MRAPKERSGLRDESSPGSFGRYIPACLPACAWERSAVGDGDSDSDGGDGDGDGDGRVRDGRAGPERGKYDDFRSEQKQLVRQWRQSVLSQSRSKQRLRLMHSSDLDDGGGGENDCENDGEGEGEGDRDREDCDGADDKHSQADRETVVVSCAAPGVCDCVACRPIDLKRRLHVRRPSREAMR